MDTVYFLNVGNGDCNIIVHNSGNISVIDINEIENINEAFETLNIGNQHKKDYPDDALAFIKSISNGRRVFRFILTHPDKDHMKGLNKLHVNPGFVNFWSFSSGKKIEGNVDWDTYKSLNTKKDKNVTAISPSENEKNKYFNQDENGQAGGDGLFIICPSNEMKIKAAQEDSTNNYSYVLKFVANNGKSVLFGGDAQEEEWDYIMKNHASDIKDIDLLISPHHGRKIENLGKALDIINPKVSLLGNFPSEYGSYDFYNKRQLKHYTNNELGSIKIDFSDDGSISYFCTNKNAANTINGNESSQIKTVGGLTFYKIDI